MTRSQPTLATAGAHTSGLPRVPFVRALRLVVLIAVWNAAPRVLPLVAQAPTGAAYVFENVTVIPMDAERTVPAQSVVVQDGKITEMGPASSVTAPAGTVSIDGTGKFLMPGLADMHARLADEDDPLRVLTVPDALFLYVASGVTTVRGMLGAPYQLELKDQIAGGELLSPNMYIGSPPLDASTAPDAASAEKLSREYAGLGYDLLTVDSSLGAEAWGKIATVAPELHISFAGEVPKDISVAEALEAGVGSVESLDSYLNATRKGPRSAMASEASWLHATDQQGLRELAHVTASAGVYVVPEQYLANHRFGYDHVVGGWVNPDTLRHALPDFKYVAQAKRDAWTTSAWDLRAEDDVNEESAAAQAEWRKELLTELHSAGVPILLGSGATDLFVVPGFGTLRELSLMVAQGLTPYEALESGTRVAARYVAEELGKAGDFGTVAPGNRADLVLLAGNPLESIDAMSSRVGVMVGGTWHSQEELQAHLDELADRYKDVDTD